MNFVKLVTVIFITLLFNFSAIAEDKAATEEVDTKLTEVEAKNKTEKKIPGSAEFDQVINDYKLYASKVKPEIRDEVVEYRKEVAKLNKQKRLLYRKLSQTAQEYLKKEQEFKSKLPVKKKNLINMQNVEAEKE